MSKFAKMRRRNEMFPWLKKFYGKYSQNFLGNTNEAVEYLLLHVDNEVKSIEQTDKLLEPEKKLESEKRKDEKALELLNILNTFFPHFWWKIRWKSPEEWENYWKKVKISQDSSRTTERKYCVKILYYMLHCTIFLTKGCINSGGIGLILRVLKLIPDSTDIPYSALLLLSDLKKKYCPVYIRILRYMLCRDIFKDVSDPFVYCNVILLFRRLLKYTTDTLQKKRVMYSALKLKPPCNIMPWLSSLNISGVDQLKVEDLTRQLLSRPYPDELLRNLLEVVLKDECLEEKNVQAIISDETDTKNLHFCNTLEENNLESSFAILDMEDSDESQLMEEIESKSKINMSTENSVFSDCNTESNANEYLTKRFTDYTLSPKNKSKKRENESDSDNKSSHKKKKMTEDTEKDEAENCPTKKKKHYKKCRKEKSAKNDDFTANSNLDCKTLLSQEDEIMTAGSEKQNILKNSNKKEKSPEEDGTQNCAIKRKKHSKKSKKHKKEKSVKLLSEEEEITIYDCEKSILESSSKKGKSSEKDETQNCAISMKRKKHSNKHKKNKSVKNVDPRANISLDIKMSQEDEIVTSDSEKQNFLKSGNTKKRFSSDTEEDEIQNCATSNKKNKLSKKQKKEKFVQNGDFQVNSNLENKTVLFHNDEIMTSDNEKQISNQFLENCELENFHTVLLHGKETQEKQTSDTVEHELKNSTAVKKHKKKKKHSKKSKKFSKEEINEGFQDVNRDTQILLIEHENKTFDNEVKNLDNFQEKDSSTHQNDFNVFTKEKQNSIPVNSEEVILAIVGKNKKKKHSKKSKKHSKEKNNKSKDFDINSEMEINSAEQQNIDSENSVTDKVKKKSKHLKEKLKNNSNKNDEISNNLKMATCNSSMSQAKNEIKPPEENNLNAAKFDVNGPLKLKPRMKKLFNLETYCNNVQSSTTQSPNLLSIDVENNSASSGEINNLNNLNHKKRNKEVAKYNSNFEIERSRLSSNSETNERVDFNEFPSESNNTEFEKTPMYSDVSMSELLKLPKVKNHCQNKALGIEINEPSTSNGYIKKSPKVSVNSAVKDKVSQITKRNKKVDPNESDESLFADNELLKASKKILELSQMSEPCSSPSLFDDDTNFGGLDNATSSSCKLEIHHSNKIMTFNREQAESLLKSSINESNSFALPEHHYNENSRISSVYERRVSEISNEIPSTFCRNSPATNIPQLFIPAECISELGTKTKSEHIDSPRSNLEEYLPNSQMCSEHLPYVILEDIRKSSSRTSSIDVNWESSITASLLSKNTEMCYSEISSTKSLFGSDLSPCAVLEDCRKPFKSARKHFQTSDPALDDSRSDCKIQTLVPPPASNVEITDRQDYILENIIKAESLFETEKSQNYTTLDVQDGSSCTNSSEMQISEVSSIQTTSTNNLLQQYTPEVVHCVKTSPFTQSDMAANEIPLRNRTHENVSPNTSNTAENCNFQNNLSTLTESNNVCNCVVDCKINDNNSNASNHSNARSISSVQVIINLNGNLSDVNTNQVIANFDFQSGCFQPHTRPNIFVRHVNTPSANFPNVLHNASALNNLPISKSSPCNETSNTPPGIINPNSNNIHNITSTEGPQQCISNPDNSEPQLHSSNVLNNEVLKQINSQSVNFNNSLSNNHSDISEDLRIINSRTCCETNFNSQMCDDGNFSCDIKPLSRENVDLVCRRQSFSSTTNSVSRRSSYKDVSDIYSDLSTDSLSASTLSLMSDIETELAIGETLEIKLSPRDSDYKGRGYEITTKKYQGKSLKPTFKSVKSSTLKKPASRKSSKAKTSKIGQRRKSAKNSKTDSGINSSTDVTDSTTDVTANHIENTIEIISRTNTRYNLRNRTSLQQPKNLEAYNVSKLQSKSAGKITPVQKKQPYDVT